MDTISTYKSRIDGLMNILFGAGVSNPQTIIEQINYLLFLRALSVKDDEAELLGIADEAGKIFTGTLSKYRWSNLLALNAEDLFKTLEESYSEIQKESANATVKLLFRNAHVKIFDKPTLRRVLHEIEEFSKELDTIAHDGNKDVFGDMYEYLLSKLSAAGTNGQFRTPRHIIDFMVRVLDPKTGETILDPACGTAGFLVAAYRHIASQYTSEKMKKAGSPRAMDKLSSEEKNFLYNHMFTGFDSDEDMIKFGMMNLHLHGLTKSRLVRQNTLVDTTGFKEKFDVVLANPPFAGKLDEESVSEDIRMNTKATEILFLRFMMDHLSDKGKMAVIVPEGVIFNASRANSKIREMLMDNGLWAVVSLPAGVFNPYAGVKTSILLLDREISKRNSELLFIKISNDGFDLGAQRHAHSHNDLPLALEILSEWKDGKKSENAPALYVEKSKIRETADYNLTADHYRVGIDYSNVKYPMIELGELCTIQRGLTYSTGELGSEDNGVPFYNLKSVKRESGSQKNDFKYFTGAIKDKHYVYKNDLLVALTDLTPNSELIGSPKLITTNDKAAFSADLAKIVLKSDTVEAQYLYYLLRSKNYRNYIVAFSHGANVKHLQSEGFYKYQIPLPPPEIQQQIVAELDGHAAIIAGAKQVTENWKPAIDIDPTWEKIKLGEICTTASGGTPSKSKPEYWVGDMPWVSSKDMKVDFLDDTEDHISESAVRDSATKLVEAETLLGVVRSGILQHTFPVALTTRPMCHNQDIVSFRANSSRLNIRYLYYMFKAENKNILRDGIKPGVTVQSFHSGFFKEYLLPLPSPEIQKQIVEKIEAERTLVESNKKLIAIYEQKTKDAIAKLWSE